MVRKIDDLGRIVVPAETRRLFNIREGDELAISVENDAIVEVGCEMQVCCST